MLYIIKIVLCLFFLSESFSAPTTVIPLVRIVGGTDAAPGEYPGIVRVITEAQGTFYLCGGTIIDLEHIVTAAHCVHGIKARKVQRTHIANAILYIRVQIVFADIHNG